MGEEPERLTPANPGESAASAPPCEVEGSALKRPFSKTPLFTANNAARYQRQELIGAIEEKTGRTLLCFVGGTDAQIGRDDTVGFVDLLHNLRPGERVDLLLHTLGGDIDEAEKLIRLLRARVGESGDIRVVIPDYAKSAGTIIALGANSILMSDSSELGAIDPQFHLKDEAGNEICHSVLRYLAAYQDQESALRANPDDPVERLKFEKFDANLVHKFHGIRDRARTLAEDLLKRQGRPFSAIAGFFMNIEVWKSHNQMIGADDMREIGLNVDTVPPEDETWQDFWSLYCLLRLAIAPNQKLFESYYVSLPI